MAKTVEVFFAIQKGQPSIQVHITDVVEGNAKEKILEMIDELPIAGPVVESLKELPPARLLANDEVTVRDVPQSSSVSRSFKHQMGDNGKITERQLWCIQDYLKRHGLNEDSYCVEYGVDCLNNLPKKAAISIIQEIKRNQ